MNKKKGAFMAEGFIETLLKMPPPKLKPTEQVISELEVFRIKCACGKPRELTELPSRFSLSNRRGVLFRDNVCFDCDRAKEWQELSVIVCINCKQVVMRVTPHTEPKTGFRFERGRCYHVEKCAACTPGLKQVAIIEKTMFYRELR